MQRFDKEVFGGLGIACRAQEQLERVPKGIDGSVEVHLGFVDLDGRFIHSPGVSGGSEVSSRALFEFGGVVLHPAVGRGSGNPAFTLSCGSCKACGYNALAASCFRSMLLSPLPFGAR